MEKTAAAGAELIFVPVFGIGHLVSGLEFAKLLLQRDDRLSITVLVMQSSLSPFVETYAKTLTTSQPRIKLIFLPLVEPPPIELLMKGPEAFICSFVDSHIPHVKSVVTDIISSRSGSVQVAGFILDLFCVSMIDIGVELGLPSYVYLTSNAGFLGLMSYLPGRHAQISTEFTSIDPDLFIPGFMNPVPVSVLPPALSNKHGAYTAYINIAQRFKEAQGIIVNTFAELEPYALKYFSDGQSTPPVYPIGPVLNLAGQPHPDLDHAQRDKIMNWLDEQPQLSVVFLCFGSMGAFNSAQVKEIALGLEQSGYRFLWSLRATPKLPPKDSSITDPQDQLPEGFLERIGGRGIICGWAPQVEVLEHKAIGGFISHCGWNSILESLWYGVPIVTWPLYAEQQLNAFRMVKELGLAVELRLDYRSDLGGNFVTAEEVERAVRSVMESESEMRKKVKEMSEMSRKALTEGGSSFISIAKLVGDIMGCRV